MNELLHSIKHWLAQYPLLDDNLKYMGVLLLAYISYVITRKIVFRILQNFSRKTKTQIDNILFNDKIIRYLSFVVPWYIIHKFAYLTGDFRSFVELTASSLMLLYILLALGNLITSMTDYYSKKEKFAGQPIKGFGQVAKIILFIFGALSIAGILTSQSPLVILTGLGALSAVLLLLFKDTILGFVASIQISSNELFKIGDWIEIPSFNADGEVVDITLHTIKIQNWDKTFTLVPTYKLVENSFKNWQGMEQSGRRRIKRNISIDVHTIKFIDAEKRNSILNSGFINDAVKEKMEGRKTQSADNETNLGLFIDYLTIYLTGRPDIGDDPVVRTLQSTPYGLPVEIYAFCTQTGFNFYENTQIEIFEHIIAIIPVFELSIYQSISGNDFQNVTDNVKKQ
jgi:miniconductance mechanosensitive channel